MSMPGAGDSYFYEWYVGLENVIKMLNPDSGIRCVVFQHDEYDTIDDVVVEYTDGNIQMCYQVKHNIETAAPKSLTFGSMLEAPKKKKCLFEAMFWGWKKACASSPDSLIKPILFTNRKIHNRRSGRHINGQSYSAYAIDQFIDKMRALILKSEDGVSLTFNDNALKCQWDELCSVLSEVDCNELLTFIKNFQIKANQSSLESMKHSLIVSLAQIFSCEDGIALELFGRLLIGLTDWTTTTRKSREVTLEEIYAVLSIGEDIDESQHRLAHPYPFFESRRSFCETIVKQIEKTSHKVIFLSGDPGSGKTSTISFLQSEYNLFFLRYHTFRPISPEQRFYNTDPGVCTTENLWGTLLIQLRKKLSGRLAELHVPISNKILSANELRSHVMRLFGILGQSAIDSGKKIYICIDGIDHAARANIPTTFLTSLPLPSEIPDGVCFILAGQPAEMYQDQYPCWLSTDKDIDHISMPKLDISDIKQLILARADQFASEANELASLIYQKTEGNNLSTVFVVEEIRLLFNLEDVVLKLQQSHICGDIQQYYSYIWAHMKDELCNIMPSVLFPESIIAGSLLLMNGRVNTRILSSALNYGISQTEWTMILNKLYPLVVRTKEDEYALFHNDFRIFLMGVIYSYKARYQEIALSLAKYLLQNNEGLISYVTGIPLLQHAGKVELIPKYFTPEFVINALSEGISKTRLDEFAHLSYDAACKNRDYAGYRNTYLAVKTLYQHKQYYDYYAKEYKSRDYPEISSIDISEIRVQHIKTENLDEFNRVLTLCWKLYSSDNEEYKERAIRLYHKWLGECSPISFVPLCAGTVSEEKPWELKSSDIGIFLQHWGQTAAKLNLRVPKIEKDLSDLNWYAVATFGEQYFSYCIEYQNYDLAINAVEVGYVDSRTFSEKLEDIYYAGASIKFSSILTRLPKMKEDPTRNLLALSIMATCDQIFLPDISLLDAVPPINRIYDQACFSITLKAFLLGCIKKDMNDATLIHCVDDYCAQIEGRKKEKQQVIFIARAASLIGKYYWNNNPRSNTFLEYAEWVLSASLQRSMDYSKARRFLLYTLLHSKPSQILVKTDTFIDALRVGLFKIDYLGMFYKSSILDFLVLHNRKDIIKEYIDDLYGENCSKISIEENKADMHKHFCPYGKLVEPEMMRQFTNKLKWDVVGYLGYKEYALYAPLDCFKIIANNDPSRWKDLGAQLYKQSEIASLSSNHAEYEIINCIAKAATACGMADYWKLRNWNDEFRLNPNQIYHSLFEFIKTANRLEDLQVIWILSCGIHSWYTQSERHGAKSIYNACKDRAHELNVDFASFVSRVTPQWETIVSHLIEESSESEDHDKYQMEQAKELSTISALHNNLSIDESLDYLTSVEQSRWATDHYAVVLDKVLTCNKNLQERLTRILHSFCIHLQGKEWAYERFDRIITPLLSMLGWDAFWALAESNIKQLSDYDYQTSTRNMQLLFRLKCQGNLAEIESLFVEELRTQRIWITGNDHFDINYDCKKAATPLVDAPQSLVEMALFILLEQADTQNARKMEIAIYAIYLLGVQFPNILRIITEQWSYFSQIQEECLLIVIARWSAKKIYSKEMLDFLLDMYINCYELSRKYYLHSILLKIHNSGVNINEISCTVPAKSYVLSQDGIAEKRSYYENFLSMVEKYKGKTYVDAIRRYIFRISPLENYKEDHFGEYSDIKIPAINMSPGFILYDREKCGELASIPLVYKKARLLPPEDPFILTEMPYMVFDDEWFPTITVTYDGKESHELTISNLHDIAHSHVGEDEVVLAASLWYPWGHNEGTIYTESCKIDFPIRIQRPTRFDVCLGNYGMLVNEEAMDESCYTTIGTGGLSLFNRVCGNFKLCFGNCQLAPSSAWREQFGCKPKNDDPYTWVDNNGQEVLRFERIASPVREVMREAYIRQPLLFRWVCNETWLKTVLHNKLFCLYPLCIKEQYPYSLK